MKNSKKFDYVNMISKFSIDTSSCNPTFQNTSNIESTPIHSFSSPRHGSVTVIGKKIFSQSCLSPEVIEEKPRYPIPIKVMTRLKRHNTQAQILIKNKNLRNLKIKCLEQPAPPAKTGLGVNGPITKNRTVNVATGGKIEKVDKADKVDSGKIEKVDAKASISIRFDKDKEKNVKGKVEKKIGCKAEEKGKSVKKIKKIIKNSIKTAVKNKKKAETLQINELKKKFYRRVMIDEINSKIRMENSAKFKYMKFKPTVPWGLDSRKFDDNLKISAQIDKQRKARRALKKSPEYQKKKELGLNDFLEVGEELGLRRCSSTVAKTEVSPTNNTGKRSPDKQISTYIKVQRKKSKELQRNKLIEKVKKETKRLHNLKLLDIESQNKTNKKSKTLKTGRLFRRKYKERSMSDNEVRKIYEDDSESNDVSNSAVKQIISRFTEESCKETEKEEKEEESKDLKVCVKSEVNNDGKALPTSTNFVNTVTSPPDLSSSDVSPQLLSPVTMPISFPTLSTDTQPDPVQSPPKSLTQPTKPEPKPKPKPKLKPEPSATQKTEAAILIQRFFRSYLNRGSISSEASSYVTEDNEVQEILSAWNSNQQQNPPDPGKPPRPQGKVSHLQDLEEMKAVELKEVHEMSEKLSKNPEMLDSLTKMIGSRYQHIADLLQNSISNENIVLQLDHSQSINSYKQELEGNKELRLLDFSFPSYESGKSINELSKHEGEIEDVASPKVETIQVIESARFSIPTTLAKNEDKEPSSGKSSQAIAVNEFSELSESDRSLHSPLPSEASSDSIYCLEDQEIGFVPSGSPVELSSQIPKPTKPTKLHKDLIPASLINDLTEEIIGAIMVDMLPSFRYQAKEEVDKQPRNYIDLLVFNMNEAEFKSRLSVPLERLPLDMLTLMHIDDLGYPESFYHFSGEPVLPLTLFSKISSNRLKSIEDEEVKFFQKTFDKLIFDNCNSILNSHRKHGAKGKPLPWDLRSQPDFHPTAEPLLILPQVLIQINKINSLSLSSTLPESSSVTLESKLRAMIVEDIENEEEGWLDYTFEQVQAQINSAEILFQVLVDEVTRILRE